jgi:tRNA pseudouridine38-40 synthase
MRTFKLTLAYDGTNYVGWQRQTNGLSIQQLVEEACEPLAGRVPTVAGAGRTDAGAHALGQVASVNMETSLAPSAVHRALNMRLPFDIRVVGVVEAPLGFHARFRARGKGYRYRIAATPVLSPFDRFFAWHVPQALDVSAMRDAAARFVGRHDFAAFQASGSTILGTERTLSRVDVIDAGGELRIEVEGDGFLRHMVRIMVGTLVDVGTGQRPASDVDRILVSKARTLAGQTVPALGLTLVSVRY